MIARVVPEGVRKHSDVRESHWLVRSEAFVAWSATWKLVRKAVQGSLATPHHPIGTSLIAFSLLPLVRWAPAVRTAGYKIGPVRLQLWNRDA